MHRGTKHQNGFQNQQDDFYYPMKLHVNKSAVFKLVYRTETYRLENLYFLFPTRIGSLLDPALDAQVIRSFLLCGGCSSARWCSKTGFTFTKASCWPFAILCSCCGGASLGKLSLLCVAVWTDIILSISLHQSATCLRDANAVAMKPLLTAITADHKPMHKDLNNNQTPSIIIKPTKDMIKLLLTKIKYNRQFLL